jgi:hypothetical protein
VSEAWPPLPDWVDLDVTPRRLRRGAEVTVALRALELIDGHDRELGLVCVAHHATIGKTTDGIDPGGRFRSDAQSRVFEDWRPLGPAALALTVPADAPYSYEGDLLSFYWGIWVRVVRQQKPDGYVPLVVEP